MGPEGASPWIKAPSSESDHSFPFSASTSHKVIVLPDLLQRQFSAPDALKSSDFTTTKDIVSRSRDVSTIAKKPQI
jgi:hypothetical protein